MMSFVREDDFHSGCRNISLQQQFPELPSPRRSHYMNYMYGSYLLLSSLLKTDHFLNGSGFRYMYLVVVGLTGIVNC